MDKISEGVKCGYGTDGGTQGKRLGGCFTVQKCTSSRWWLCTYSPDRFDELIDMQVQHTSDRYNEIIVESSFLDSHVPSVIEAIFYIKGNSEGQTKARNA